MELHFSESDNTFHGLVHGCDITVSFAESPSDNIRTTITSILTAAYEERVFPQYVCPI